MKKKHMLSATHPLLSMLLASGVSMAAISLTAGFGASVMLGYWMMSVAAVFCLLLQKWWFSPVFRGAFKAEISGRELGVLCLPFLAQCLLACGMTAIDSGWRFQPTALGLAMAVSAGFVEETVFRGLTIPIGMRYLKGKNKIFATALLTSLIFGASHLGNVTQGASATMAAIQAAAASGVGLFLAAVFLRSGSIWPPIFLHGFFDWLCFTTDSRLQAGIMMNRALSVGLIGELIVDLAIGAAGLYLLRPAIREKIEAVWQKKWE